MRLPILIILSFLAMACTRTTQNEGELIAEELSDSIEHDKGQTLAKAVTYKFNIPGDFTQDSTGDIDTTLSNNYLSIEEGQLVAKKYLLNQQEITAVCYEYNSAEQGITKCSSHILARNKNGEIVDLIDAYFPEMDVYAFYDFGDKKLRQLEGDEQTVFAGYQLDFSQEDSLGIQFMFCNKMDAADTDSLNKDGVVRYVSLEEVK